NDCLEDCAGVFGGDATLDACGVCNGNGIPEGACDCAGNVLDACGECGGNGTDDDEDGICDADDACVGTYDACGQCNGPGAIYACGCTDLLPNACDCEGNVLDACGVCAGNGTDDDEDGICDAQDDCIGEYDVCNVCNGDDSTCAGEPQNKVTISIGAYDHSTGTIELVLESTHAIGGFQFGIHNEPIFTANTDSTFGIEFVGASNGFVEQSGLTISGSSTSATSAATILAFSLIGTSIPASTGLLTIVEIASLSPQSASQLCLTDMVISDVWGNALLAEAGPCLDLCELDGYECPEQEAPCQEVTCYWDGDEDGLGDEEYTYTDCVDDPAIYECNSGYVTNNTDPEPECATNDTDSCGICGGMDEMLTDCHGNEICAAPVQECASCIENIQHNYMNMANPPSLATLLLTCNSECSDLDVWCTDEVDFCAEDLIGDESCILDCNGQWNGSASVDACGACVPDSESGCDADLSISLGEFDGSNLDIHIDGSNGVEIQALSFELSGPYAIDNAQGGILADSDFSIEVEPNSLSAAGADNIIEVLSSMLLTGLKLDPVEKDEDEDKNDENNNLSLNGTNRGQDQEQIPDQLCLDDIRFTLVNGEEFSAAESICLTLSEDSDLTSRTTMLLTELAGPVQELEYNEFVVGQSNAQEESPETHDITDVTSVINLILDGEYDANYDLDGNGNLAITDVISLVNIILGN
ncbi:MAG: hypothetical protein QGI45_01650, partial [Myxococcota bacterium]|nr:hypothetical protein [Myxococcota bacterium]